MLSEREKQVAKANKTSRKRAIELQCKDCIYDPAAGGTWRKQADECPAEGCPLWNFRPRVRRCPREEKERFEQLESVA
jgi:hypothetical protein